MEEHEREALILSLSRKATFQLNVSNHKKFIKLSIYK